MALLYSHLLQSLYRSQILTMGVVFVSILLMFIVLFRRISLAIVAILPNLLAACAVLGLMGWWGIPLDIMTITIAAITVGIAVDHAIHYIHRFQVEFVRHQTYRETIMACHGSIGRAIYYTALTITVGFSILAFSDFIPTIYFGLLTGFAMMVALMSNLTLLAALLIIVKPLGPHPRNAVVRVRWVWWVAFYSPILRSSRRAGRSDTLYVSSKALRNLINSFRDVVSKRRTWWSRIFSSLVRAGSSDRGDVNAGLRVRGNVLPVASHCGSWPSKLASAKKWLSLMF